MLSELEDAGGILSVAELADLDPSQLEAVIALPAEPITEKRSAVALHAPVLIVDLSGKPRPDTSMSIRARTTFEDGPPLHVKRSGESGEGPMVSEKEIADWVEALFK